MATKQRLLHLDHRLLGVARGTVGIEFRGKVGLEDRFQHSPFIYSPIDCKVALI